MNTVADTCGPDECGQLALDEFARTAGLTAGADDVCRGVVHVG